MSFVSSLPKYLCFSYVVSGNDGEHSWVLKEAMSYSSKYPDGSTRWVKWKHSIFDTNPSAVCDVEVKKWTLTLDFVSFFASYYAVPLVAPTQIPALLGSTPTPLSSPPQPTFPTFPFLPPSKPPCCLKRSHHLCQTVGHVWTSAEPGPSVHRGQHSSAQRVLGLWISCGGMGVNIWDIMFATSWALQMFDCYSVFVAC